MYTVAPTIPAQPAKIAIVGEAPTSSDIKSGFLFSGYTGKFLTNLLHDARILREDCFITSVFDFASPTGDLADLCTKKKEADLIWRELGNEGKYPHKAIMSAKYLRAQYLPSLDRLREELIAADPNIIVTLGATALWALTGSGGITKNRGTVVEVDLGGPRTYKVIPTFHPQYVLKKWDARSLVIADLMKTKAESLTSEVNRPVREIWLAPTIADMEEFWEKHLASETRWAWDIETIPRAGLLTCIGFGTATHAICIPFFDGRAEDGNYWKSAGEEAEAWRIVKRWLLSPAGKVTQNGMYDMQWVWKKHGLTTRGPYHDTQLLHHSMYSEMKKDLGTLGSLYTNEIAWKQLNPARKTEGKKDE